MESKFLEFLEKTKKSRKDDRDIPRYLLSIDPGKVSGWAVFRSGELWISGKIEWTKERGWDPIVDKIQEVHPDVVICEDYRIYSGKRLVQAWSPVDTIRIIGAIEFVCRHDSIKLVKQMASGIKGFVDDTKLKDWDMWNKNEHVRDSIRHGVYALLFNKECF